MKAITDTEILDMASRNPRAFLGIGVTLTDGSRAVIGGANGLGFEVMFKTSAEMTCLNA